MAQRLDKDKMLAGEIFNCLDLALVAEHVDMIVAVEASRDVHSGRAGHAVLATGASYLHEFRISLGRPVDQLELFLRQRVRIRFPGDPQVFLDVLLIIHA